MRKQIHFPGEITADTIDDVIAWHRATFGGCRMEDDGKGGGNDDGKNDDGKNDDGKGKGGDEYKAPATQADLDRIIGDRLAREREKYADYDDLKAKAAKADKAAEDAMTEAEKAVEKARKEGETSATEKSNGRLVRAEARALAATAKFRDPSDAVAFLDLSKVKVGDDGEVDADAIKTELKKLADEKPYLVDDGKTGKPKPDKSQGGGDGNSSSSSVQKGREMFAERHKRTTQQAS